MTLKKRIERLEASARKAQILIDEAEIRRLIQTSPYRHRLNLLPSREEASTAMADLLDRMTDKDFKKLGINKNDEKYRIHFETRAGLSAEQLKECRAVIELRRRCKLAPYDITANTRPAGLRG